MQDPYEDLAADYEWLKSDGMLRGEFFCSRFAACLNALPYGARVLDCACGTGTDALALRRAGFEVIACDASPAMVRRAHATALAAGVDISFEVCSWAELGERYTEPFDAVFCVGNSLVHAAGELAMTAALRSMRDVLRRGGVLVVDSRNWERLRSERPSYTVADAVVERHGKRCIAIYAWTIPDAWRDEHRADLLLVFEQEGRLAHRHHELRYYPFRVEELRERLHLAGFSDDEWEGVPEADWFSVQAIRA